MTTTSRTIGAIPAQQNSVSHSSNGLRSLDNEDLLSRLLRLQTAGPPPGGPPLDLYRTETGEHGEVYIATNEYREWFLRTYPRAGSRSEVSRPTPCGEAEGSGGKKPLDRFKPH